MPALVLNTIFWLLLSALFYFLVVFGQGFSPTV